MSNYYTSLDCKAQKRYTSKLMLDGDDVGLPDPYNISSDLWLNDVTEWPNLEFGDLFMYLIDTDGIYTKEKLKAYKSLDAYNYYFNGYVQNPNCNFNWFHFACVGLHQSPVVCDQ